MDTENCRTDLAQACEGAELVRRQKEEERFREASDTLGRVLGTWRGETLADIRSDAVRTEAERIEQWRTFLLLEYLDLKVGLGDYRDAIPQLQGLISQDPYREEAHVLLVRSLYGSGHRGDALRAYQRARDLLAEGLGLEPGTELTEVHAQVLRGEPLRTLEERTLPHGTGQGPADEDRTDRFAVLPRQLPPLPSDFFGRTGELSRLRAFFERSPEEAVPLCGLITGMGGVGKTALSLNVAHRIAYRYPDGQLYCDMRGYTSGTQPVDAAEALEGFLRAQGVPTRLIPADLEERSALFRSVLFDKQVLILLDNVRDFEQVRSLLPGTPGSAVLITSRSNLTELELVARVSHERLAALDQSDALELFQALTGRHKKDTDDYAHLVRLCDGLPLALRIVAARLSPHHGWTPVSLLRRLTDEHQRLAELSHGSVGLAAGFALSCQGLSHGADVLFRRLGLLDLPDLPDWTATALLDVDMARGQDLMRELLDAHLVEVVGQDAVGQTRFRMHDLVRLYARERAGEESEEEALEAVGRVLRGWLGLAATAWNGDMEFSGPGLLDDTTGCDTARFGVEAVVCAPFDWMVAERPSMVAATVQAVELGLDDLAWKLAVLCKRVFAAHSYLEEWRHTHELVLELMCRVGNRRGEAAMLFGLGQLFSVRASEAVQYFERSLRISLDIGDRRGCGLALAELAKQDRIRGQWESALNRCLQARSLLREAGDVVNEGIVLLETVHVHVQLGHYDEAEAALAEIETGMGGAGYSRLRPQVLRREAQLRLARGDLVGADEVVRAALDMVRETADEAGESVLLCLASEISLGLGRVLDAYRKAARALEITERLDIPLFHLRAERMMARVRREMGDQQAERQCVGEGTEGYSPLDAVREGDGPPFPVRERQKLDEGGRLRSFSAERG